MRRRSAVQRGMSLSEYTAWQDDRKRRTEQRKAPTQRITKTCCECGNQFETGRLNQILCGSDECKRTYGNRYTSAYIMRRYYHEPEFRDKTLALTNARRADKLGLGSRRITIGYLLNRDNHRCGICHTRIRTHDDASLDHIIPLSKGGPHSLENVQAAHKRCNYAKGARGGNEQLLLVG